MTNPKDREAELLESLDRNSIRETTVRYFFGLDARDWAALSQCFTSDATWQSSADNVVISGNKTIVEKLHSIARFTATSHMASSQSINVTGDTATVDTFALVHIVVGPSGTGRVFVRGLRYLDEFARTPEGWRIHRRKHIPIWQYSTETIPTTMPKPGQQ